MLQISAEELKTFFTYTQLTQALEEAFCSEIIVPLRHHHEYKNPKVGTSSTLLLMPAWEESKYLGVKMVCVSPQNTQQALSSIQGVYILSDATNGVPLAIMDAKELTNWRTAAASALASTYLSRPDSSTLLMIGTGTLAPYLIEAHATVRPIKNVYIWGRNSKKAQHLSQQFASKSFRVLAISDLNTYIPKADIISCATLSKTPLLQGAYLREGQHIDLVGSYKPDMREADDVVIQRSRIFVDTREGALKETGDLVIPIQKGIISKNAIQSDLFELCKKEKKGRQTKEEITLFKSVGHALEDLAAAKFVYKKRNA